MEQPVATGGKQVDGRPTKPARPRKMERDFFEGKHLSPQERRAAGKASRDKVPRESHGEWKERPGRPDPIAILIASDKGHIPELVPIRHGRMLTSPFAFLRGTAAADLAMTPVSGIRVAEGLQPHLASTKNSQLLR
jgi:hypothetical protein